MNKSKKLLIDQKNFFKSDRTKDVKYRREQLIKLKASIENNESKIFDALKKDLNKSKFESYATEISIVKDEIKYMLKNLKHLTKPKRVKTPITQFPSKSKIHKEPYGSVLIIAPWNYPFQLAISPLVGAIAAGNCAVIKPSEYAPHTSEVISKMIKDCYQEEYITVVQEGIDVNQSLLKMKFDYIFFTGSIPVGKYVMAEAAKNLIPVTLELGGKSPCIVDETANIELAAKRIVWGKFLNAGQTCVAPDYILVHESIRELLMKEIQNSIVNMWGENPQSNVDYPKIINEKHFDRLNDLIGTDTVFYGGSINQNTLQIAPTLMHPINWDSEIMKDEIFGPILPIIEYKDMDYIVQQIKERPKPLALYMFTKSKENEAKVLSSISFGGRCINDVIVQLATSNMPFGGVGESGMGSYHGESSFKTFSHNKSIMKKSNLLDIELRYPPFVDSKIVILKKLFNM